MFSLAFIVLVLCVSSTRIRRYGIEYEYHFIEYEYDKSQNSATSKGMNWCGEREAHGGVPASPVQESLERGMLQSG
jgi:hypothetical protein